MPPDQKQRVLQEWKQQWQTYLRWIVDEDQSALQHAKG